jgi:hypothetical protein
MTFDELYQAVSGNPDVPVHIMLPSGEFVPSHFHISEIGRVQKDFIDCGGVKRQMVTCLMQIWIAQDYDHRLNSSKLKTILELAKTVFDSAEGNLPIEFEHDGESVSQYPLLNVEATPSGLLFLLAKKHTDCLAPDRCGVGANGSTCC